MGKIQKQSVSGTIYSYIGVALGFLSTGYLMPRLLLTDEVGLLRLLVSYSTLMAQFAVLGFGTVTVKLFPYFRDEKKQHHGFLGMALLVGLVGFIVVTIVYLSFQNYILENAKEKSALFIPYFYYVIPLVFFTLVFGILDNYFRVLYNAVVGIVYKEVVQRVLILITIILYYFKAIDFHLMVILYMLALVSPGLLLFIKLAKDKMLYLKPDFGFINRKLAKEIISVAFFGIVASYSGVLVMNVDILMINDYLGLSDAGIYAITFFFGAIILVPIRTMGKISSVIISDSWKIDDTKTVFNIYQKSTLSLGVIGVLLFVGIVGNIDNVMFIIGKNYESGRYVIILIALANLFDVFQGVSPHVLVNSKHYKWLSYLLIGFALLVVLTNLIFIPKYGILGAALASMISKAIYNLAKFLFLYGTFKFQPYGVKHILLLVAGFLAFISVYFIPEMLNAYFDILIRSIIISVVFVILIYWWRISVDINAKLESIFWGVVRRNK